MNKFILSAIAGVMLSSGLAQAASGGTINFQGQLSNNTCEVVVDGQASNPTVTLPIVSIGQLGSAAQTAGLTGFTLALANCSGSLKTASAFFEAGAAVDVLTGRLKNTGTAQNVSLQLRDGTSASQAVIKAGNADQINGNSFVNVEAGSTNLPYFVEYYAEGTTTPGTVVSSVVYSIQYK
ncbi:fimbrial protein [Serratia fonticola]|uniref:fimbrial protein n=1 Tax=Serratia fonticola TaxID=47917 RepID=UPI0003AEDBBB|nr:fimbrial protein [Serratia fonticola]ERK05489.1 P pilus assembly protein, pilin FimA [Serratia fonticola AU-AP2C]MBP0999843.1 type 1 fimbrial protein [Serratia fonticola]MBP1004889.1 type 1 fimbrial protein [Serratia fonticola]MBP1014568.1 type 1 fimbrial protein [Serratia fonticola]MBP1019685.1 type 1 fimbrial protein [Serratia fonticola]